MKKRIIALLAVCVMLVSVFGMTVSASAETADETPIVVKSADYNSEKKLITVIIANTSSESYIVTPHLTAPENDEIIFTIDEALVNSFYQQYYQQIASLYGTEIADSYIAYIQQDAEMFAAQELDALYATELGAGKEATFEYDVEGATDDYFVLDISIDYQNTNALVKNLKDHVAPVIQTVSESDILDETTATPKEAVINFLKQTAVVGFMENPKCLIMILIACVLMYLAIGRGYEPLLLLPIAFGMLLTNLPGAEMFHEELFAEGHVHWNLFDASNNVTPGLIDILYLGVKLGIYPCLIFFGVGAMTDFGPLIANPKSLLLGAAAQLGIFATYVAATASGYFNPAEAGSIGIIGGADGPTAIYVTSRLAPHLLGPIAVAAYSYMALVPVIQPPIMKLLTTKKERCIEMKALRPVSKREKILFPIVVTIFVAVLVPSAAPLVGSLMLGNLFKESGVTERLSKTVQNELMNIVTIFLGISVGATATADTFLDVKTLLILAMGVIAFGLGTAGGVLLAKFMNLFLKNKINPLIGSAGVSAVPMAARVSQIVGQKDNPRNFLLMHAMGPNVAGVIGSAIAAGVLMSFFG